MTMPRVALLLLLLLASGGTHAHAGSLQQAPPALCATLPFAVPSCAFRANRDVVFVLDTSNSVDRTLFYTLQLDFVKSVACAFDPEDETRLGLITFGSQVATRIPLKKYAVAKWFALVESLRSDTKACCSPGAPTVEALNRARQVFTNNPSSNDKVTFVMTAGEPYQVTTAKQFSGSWPYPKTSMAEYMLKVVPNQARRLKQMSRLMVVGVRKRNGSYPDDRYFKGIPSPARNICGGASPNSQGFRYKSSAPLQCGNMSSPPFPIVSTPVRDNWFTAAEAVDLTSLVQTLIPALCSVTPEPTQAPSVKPTQVPTQSPTFAPSRKPTTSLPSRKPTRLPTKKPTKPTRTPTRAPTRAWVQQGNKLIGTNGPKAQQGSSVAVSSDGNTLISGGQYDNADLGAAWIFVRSGQTWSQQGEKLVGSGAVGSQVNQGYSVSISADGNTAAVGGPGDNNGIGATWVFVRSNSTWAQQGGKLVGAGFVGTTVSQATSVAIASNGNTILVGGHNDNSGVGCAWVFVRSGSKWSQSGGKLVGSGATGGVAYQGWSVALSGDGHTAVVGGASDADGLGAAWIFVQMAPNQWTQQGSKLVGTGSIGASEQGWSVALSSDGNTAIVGGYGDNNYAGAAWVFTRSGTTWSQMGGKLVGSGGGESASQGWSVSMSGDGRTAVLGGTGDFNGNCAAWVFTLTFTSDWSQQGAKLVGSGYAGDQYQFPSVAISGDGSTLVNGGSRDEYEAGAVWVFTSIP